MMKAAEVEQKLLEWVRSIDNDGYYDTSDDENAWNAIQENLSWGENENPTIPGLGTVTMLPESATGGEGSAEQCYIILRINFEDGSVKHFEKGGWYASYDGTHWDGELYRVNPKQVNVTKYVRIKEED